jgi:hypothetical protein
MDLGTKSIIEQLGIKKACLACKVHEARTGSLKDYFCYSCGNCYTPEGHYSEHLTKQMIYREFADKKVYLSEQDVDLIFWQCRKGVQLAFGATLNLILATAIEKRAKKC